MTLAVQHIATPSLGGLFCLLLALALAQPNAHAMAQQVGREQEIVDLRLGQRVLVDDGTCPTGQIKEVSGARMTSAGIMRTRRCIPRIASKPK